jgi:allantoicase
MPDTPDFASTMINLASRRLGAKAVRASDEFFAAKERMLVDAAPVFLPDEFDDNGKWMDGWETRRRRGPGHDWCVIRLGIPGTVHGVDIDTSHFTGNYAPAASVDGVLFAEGGEPGPGADWRELVVPTPLGGDASHPIAAKSVGPVNYLRLNIYPDGGVARFRVYGRAYADFSDSDRNKIYELSALRNGASILAYSDAHYGDVWALLNEGRGTFMGDGWETRRRREPGYDWIIVTLGAPCHVTSVEVDTAHVKGNYPDRCSINATYLEAGAGNSIIAQSQFWPRLMHQKQLSADKVHLFSEDDLQDVGPVTHVRLNIHPDGGVSRFRVFGRLAG